MAGAVPAQAKHKNKPISYYIKFIGWELADLCNFKTMGGGSSARLPCEPTVSNTTTVSELLTETDSGASAAGRKENTNYNADRSVPSLSGASAAGVQHRAWT